MYFQSGLINNNELIIIDCGKVYAINFETFKLNYMEYITIIIYQLQSQTWRLFRHALFNEPVKFIPEETN